VRALIDADNLAFACAASAEEEDVEVACTRADSFIENILAETGATEYELWFSGDNNFRYNVYPEYKGNRKASYRPLWEKEVKQYITEKWEANWTDDIEADDMLGIRQLECTDTILAHLDKDLNQIKGLHYNWELRRLGEVVREKRIYTVSNEEADYWFFYQLLVGDTTDNIKGVRGIGPKKAAGILHGCESNRERYEAVLGRYSSEEELDLNAQCVYIHRKLGDHWRNIIGDPAKL
jgi:DNA polymerase-1